MVDKHAAVARQRRRVAVSHPCVVANGDGQVQVFGSVLKLFIPSPDRLESLALHEKAEPGQHANRMHVRQSAIVLDGLEPHYAVGHRATGQKPAPFARRHHPVKPFAQVREGVVVKKQNPRGRALAREQVVAARKVDVLLAPLDRDFEPAIQPNLGIGVHPAHEPVVAVIRVVAAVVQEVQGIGNTRRPLHQVRQEPRRDLAGVVRQHADIHLGIQTDASIGCTTIPSVVSAPCSFIRSGMGTAVCSIRSPSLMYWRSPISGRSLLSCRMLTLESHQMS